MKPSSPRILARGERDSDASIRDRAARWKARVDAGLTADEERQLRVWLDADPRHRAAISRCEKVWEKFDRPFQTGTTRQLVFELEQRARREKTRTRAVASAVALAALFVAAAQTHRGKAILATLGWGNSAPASAIVVAPERRSLPDGSVAELKPGAVLRVEFGAALRRVVLSEGEAHFEVKPDPARPFVVAADGVEARAVGTAFAVQMGPDTVEVIVTHGRVAVGRSADAGPSPAAHDANGNARSALLDVGHSIVVERTALTPRVPRVSALPPGEIEERLAWRAPRVEFTSTTLAEAVRVLNDHAAKAPAADPRARRFVLSDSRLGEERISGLFRIDRTDAFVNLLKHGFGIEAVPGARNEILLRRPAAGGEP